MSTHHAATRRSTVINAVGVVGMLGALTIPGIPGLPDLSDILGSQQSQPPTAAEFQKMGTTSSASGRLSAGCHDHTWHYSVKPTTKDWVVEIFLIGPKGGHVASDALLSGAAGKTGSRTFRICKNNTHPGTFTIKGRMTVQDDENDKYTGWIESSTFKMAK